VKLRNVYVVALLTITALLGTCPLYGQASNAGTAKTTTAIQVEMIGVDNLSVPKEFEVSLYENLLRKLSAKGDYEVIYRAGNRNAQTSPYLVRMRSTITAFKEGSERDRQVTTVKGATRIKVHCQFIDQDGTVLLQRDIEGKVLFFGDNLKATEDFAKKATKAADDALATYRAKLEHEGRV
jgi:hypothetical protein